MPQFSPYRSRKGSETGNSLTYREGGGVRVPECCPVLWGKIPVLRLLKEFDSLKKADSGSGTAI